MRTDLPGGGASCTERNSSRTHFKKTPAASALLAALLSFSAACSAAEPALPTLPDASIWDVECSGDTCQEVTTSSTLESAYRVDGRSQTQLNNSIVGKQLQLGSVSDQTVIVRGIPASAQTVNLIFASSTSYSQHDSNTGTHDNNTLLIELGNDAASPLRLAGISSSAEPTIAASAHMGGVASSNSLLIRNSALQHADSATNSLVTAAYVYNLYDPSGGTAAYNDNLLVIENSSMRSAGNSISHNINLAAAYLVGWYPPGTRSPYEASRNKLYVIGSELDVKSMWTVYNYGSNTQASEANDNWMSITDSNINLNFVSSYDNVTRRIGISNSSMVVVRAFDKSSNNVLYVARSTIDIDQLKMPAAAVTDGFGQITISAAQAGDVAQNNLTQLEDVDFTLTDFSDATITIAPDITIGSAGAVVYNNYHQDKIARDNTTRIVSTTGPRDWTLNGGKRRFVIFGGRSILTPQAMNSSQGVEKALAESNHAVVENIRFNEAAIYGGWVQHVHDVDEAFPEVLTGTPQAVTNTVDLTNVSVEGTAQIAGGLSVQGEASGNKVTVTGGQYVKTTFAGGYVERTGSAAGNEVTVSNTTLTGSEIYGGRIDGTVDAASQATDNVVVIGDNVVGADGGAAQLERLYGGYLAAGNDVQKTFAGNELHISSLVTTAELGGFQHYSFFINNESARSGAFITVTGAQPVVLQPDGAQASTVAVGGTGLYLTQGSSYTLIDSAAGFTSLDGAAVAAGTDLSALKQDVVMQDVPSVIRVDTTTISKDDYELAIVDEAAGAQSLQMQVTGGAAQSSSVNSQTDTLVESSLSALATVFAADDLFVDTVLRSRTGKREGLFASARAGRYSYDTNTRLETNIVSGLVGFSAAVGSSNVGAFLEMGHASYDSRLNSALGAVRGEGTQNYAGVGVFVDYGLPVEGWRLTGYVKGGSLANDFNAVIAGLDAGYDKSSAYWGAHLGTHYDIDMPGLTTRVFFSYFYDGRESESYDIGGTAEIEGAHVEYDALNAHRVQAGGIFEFKMSERLRPYLGLTFEQILSAKAEGTATDSAGTLALKSSDLEGSTGILSAGWTYMNETGSFSCEFGLNGYAGTRNGVSGQIQGLWRF